MGKLKTRRVAFALPVLAVCVAVATVSAAAFRDREAADAGAGFLVGSRENRERLASLFALLDAPGIPPEENFAVTREISNNLFREGEYGRLIRFLGARTLAFPEDRFNAHHLLMIAYAYTRQGSVPIAARYFDLIVKNFPDLTINGTSVHLTSLLRLIDLESDPGRLSWYYRELISRFADYVDLGVVWFRLAQAYERMGEWAEAMRAYVNFLTLGAPDVPGFPAAAAFARRQVALNNSSRNWWTFATLPALGAAVRHALDTNNAASLRSMQTGVDFFTRSWSGHEDIESRIPFNIMHFMWGTRIRHADRFHERSGADEAFLRTWGWPQVIPVWYFHFRRIHFPADPNIHGRWEWVGVYYGESF